MVCIRACSVNPRAELQRLVKGVIVQLPEGAQNTLRGYLEPSLERGPCSMNSTAD